MMFCVLLVVRDIARNQPRNGCETTRSLPTARKLHPPHQVPSLYVRYPEVTRAREKRDVATILVVFLYSMAGCDEVPAQKRRRSPGRRGPGALSAGYNPLSCNQSRIKVGAQKVSSLALRTWGSSSHDGLIGFTVTSTYSSSSLRALYLTYLSTNYHYHEYYHHRHHHVPHSYDHGFAC